MFVTCGPFECGMGPVAPAIDISHSPTCEAWMPEVELQVGFVDNTVLATYDINDDGDTEDDDETDRDNGNDGLDVGWRYTSSAAMGVEHHFGGVANGSNFSVGGPDAGKSSGGAAIKMVDDDVEAKDYRDAIAFAAGLDGDADTADDNDDEICADANYGSGALDAHKPAGCFRVTADGDEDDGANYVAGYSIELTAKDSAVSWGDVKWEENPFEDLTCESVTVMMSDHVDVCMLFEAEVDAALADGWGGSKGTSVTIVPGADDDSDELLRLEIAAPSSAKARQFATLWFSNNDGGKNKPDRDIYVDKDGDTDGVQRSALELTLMDGDGDPKYGDFGKVDLVNVGADGIHDTGEADPGLQQGREQAGRQGRQLRGRRLGGMRRGRRQGLRRGIHRGHRSHPGFGNRARLHGDDDRHGYLRMGRPGAHPGQPERSGCHRSCGDPDESVRRVRGRGD